MSGDVARAHRETIAATECLLERAEESRAVGWTNLTTPAGIQNNIFINAPANAAALPQLQETITVSPYPALTPDADPHWSCSAHGRLRCKSYPSQPRPRP